MQASHGMALKVITLSTVLQKGMNELNIWTRPMQSLAYSLRAMWRRCAIPRACVTKYMTLPHYIPCSTITGPCHRVRGAQSIIYALSRVWTNPTELTSLQ